ncbi:MAG: anaerobic sulfatase maturase [Candidatus Aminicenantes bacterium]|nr:anaerobic sulfatase maturase [Candidatus Aminicenantes bacterium]
MDKASREFQVFAKPAGSLCNLDCVYCYYINKKHLYPKDHTICMSDEILEEYIKQHLRTSPDPEVRFSWHGGEPTILGLDYFFRIVELQQKHRSPQQRILNGIQTNGILLNEEWCRFFTAEGFSVGLSLDGPQELHDSVRLTKDKKPTHKEVMRGHELLRKHHISNDILCVVNAKNVRFPTQIYDFFKEIGASYVSFLPVVEPQFDGENGVSPLTVEADAWGEFLCTIFDEWVVRDIGKIKIQIFEEASRTAFEQDHSLCIFRPICGDIPVIEHNGDFFSCDHFVEKSFLIGNIMETPLVKLIESPQQIAFGLAKLESLPQYCLKCKVRSLCNGECPKNRFHQTPDEEEGLNYLCAGYKRFFNHCRPFISQVAAEWKKQKDKKCC